MKTRILFFFLLIGGTSFGQQDEQMSMYLHNKLYLNPAYAGSRDAVSLAGVARFQWVNFKGAPNTQWFSAHAPFFNKMLGVGAHMVNDRVGSRRRTSIYADVSGGIPLAKGKQRLAVGLSGGIDMIGYDFTQLKTIDPQDPYASVNYQENRPNVGAGIYYYGDKFFVSLSSPRMLEAKPKSLAVDTIVQKLNARHFFLSGGYVFKLNSMFKLHPATLLKFTPNAPITIDVNLNLIMMDKLWIGLLYRYHEAMGVNLMYNIKEVFSIGYVYDFPINGLRTYQTGSHEIFLRYDIKPKNKTFTSPRYF